MRLLRFQAKDRLDRWFEIGIVLKGLNGAVELTAGLILAVVGPSRLRAFVIDFASPRVTANPNDLIAVEILRGTSALTAQTVQFAAIYLLAQGAVKLVLVVALLQNRLWAYPVMITVLVGFISYQLYRIVFVAPNPGLLVLTAFDSVILVLTWREYRRRRRHRASDPSSDSTEPVEASS
jgi:uncharacterized membrane protein